MSHCFLFSISYYHPVLSKLALKGTPCQAKHSLRSIAKMAASTSQPFDRIFTVSSTNTNKLFISAFALTLSPDRLWAILVELFFPSGNQSQNLIKSPKFYFVKYYKFFYKFCKIIQILFCKILKSKYSRTSIHGTPSRSRKVSHE